MDAEVNDSVVENISNITNATGREAATPEGIAITYGSLFVMALLPLFFGSLRSVGYHVALKVSRSKDGVPTTVTSGYHFLQGRGEEAGDRIAMKDAAMFPVYASAGLFGLYLFFKVWGVVSVGGTVCTHRNSDRLIFGVCVSLPLSISPKSMLI